MQNHVFWGEQSQRRTCPQFLASRALNGWTHSGSSDAGCGDVTLAEPSASLASWRAGELATDQHGLPLSANTLDAR